MSYKFRETDIIPTAYTSAAALSFNVPDWTHVHALPGRTNFTGHSRTVQNEGTIIQAKTIFALETLNCAARTVGMNYVGGVQTWYTNWGSVVHNGPNNLQQLQQDIALGINAALTAAGYVYLFVQVKGAGKLYLARTELLWS